MSILGSGKERWFWGIAWAIAIALWLGAMLHHACQFFSKTATP
jgi:hypothetical protein